MAIMEYSAQKGDLLEKAVKAIEETILQESPGLKHDAFRIESKKLLFSDGVKHEIDLWVSVDVGKGYDAVFIFECKNWEDKVGKNEIIVFSEKIDVAAAQRGFFVAKSFTKDAVAQAAKDRRIQLLIVADLPTENVPVPLEFHIVIMDAANIELTFKDRAMVKPGPQSKRIKVTEVVFGGERLNIQPLSSKWAEKIWSERSRTFPSGTLPEGLYPVTSEGEMHFEPGQLVAEGHDIERVAYKCAFSARVVRPAIISYFNVESRGRSMQLAPVQFGSGGSLQVTFTALEPTE
jgi:hypothetical protein